MQTWLMDTGINRLVVSLCRMLVHSLWQGLLLVVIAAMVLAVAGKKQAALRYNLLVILFSLFLITCAGNFAWQWNHYSEAATATLFAGIQGFYVPGIAADSWQYTGVAIAAGNEWLSSHAQVVVGVWMGLLAIRMMQLLPALLYNHRTRFRQVSSPPKYWTETLQRLCAALQVNRTVELLETGFMKMPVVIGHFKPVILIPAGLLLRLPADEAEAILLHELAHIRRNDYLVNIIQHIAETLFFFNPAVHWVSGRIREEREACCDEVAVQQSNNKKALVAALISFKQLELYGNVYQTAFPGRKDQLLRRVNHILGNRPSQPAFTEKLFIAGCFVLLAITGSVALLQGSSLAKNQPATTSHPAASETAVVTNAMVYTQNTVVEKPVVTKKRIIRISKAVLFKREPAGIITGAVLQQWPLNYHKLAISDKESALTDGMNAKLDRERALLDYKRALHDQQQALHDQEQAARDQQQAKADQQQAFTDQQHAYNAQQQALKSKLDAEQAKLKESSLQ